MCPDCFEENAFFNGICYVCPECGYEWGYDDDEEEEEEDI